jgi:hypothetical protein
MKPSTPKAAVMPSTTQTWTLRRSANSSEPTNRPARIMKPPMVGVPAFSVTWRAMPSVRIGWPLPCLAFIQRMKREPMATATT